MGFDIAWVERFLPHFSTGNQKSSVRVLHKISEVFMNSHFVVEKWINCQWKKFPVYLFVQSEQEKH